MISYPSLKRPIDLAASAVGLVLLSPVLVVLSLAILLAMGPPVFYRQRRIGRDGAPFVLYKFRTMRQASGPGELSDDASRLTGLGRILRAASLDELPELFNVLRGDMSLVGPRPLLPEYLELYTPDQARRHEVRPGITGLAQVNGRNALSWEKKFELDVRYVDHCSAWGDLSILILTVATVFRGHGVSATGHATMPRFEGTRGGRAR